MECFSGGFELAEKPTHKLCFCGSHQSLFSAEVVLLTLQRDAKGCCLSLNLLPLFKVEVKRLYSGTVEYYTFKCNNNNNNFSLLRKEIQIRIIVGY